MFNARFIKIFLLLTLFFSSVFADDTTSSWSGSDDSSESLYNPKVKHQDMSFLEPLELAGMASGIYLVCKSDLMANAMSAYKTKPDLWSVIGNTGMVILTVFAGTIVGGVSSALVFGPMDPDFETIKSLNLSDGAKGTMIASGVIMMTAGAYAGYVIGGKSPQKYGEEILIGSLAGAIIGSYVGEQLGTLIFGKAKKQN